MRPDPVVSVICTARDASRTIEATLRSTLEQTLSRWEMIVVDDGSSDDTAAIAAAYARHDRRITVMQTPAVGRGRALNLALSCARAELVANIDADDASHPRRLELQSALMVRSREISVLCTAALFVHDQEPLSWPQLGQGGAIQPTDVTRTLALRNPVVHSSVMLRRADVLHASGYAEDIGSQLDYELWVRMAARGFRIYRLDLPLIAKRVHDNRPFDVRRRLMHLHNSARVQREAIRVCRAPRHYIAAAWGRLMFELLPGPLRHALHRGPPGRTRPPWRSR